MGFDVGVGWILPDVLQELAFSGKRDLVAELLLLFQSDTESRLAELRTAAASGDRRRVRTQAHSLKGSAAQVGAVALADSCRELELTAETRADLLPLLEEIEERFAMVSRSISLEYGAVQSIETALGFEVQ
jgi:HPt (histidine-containing phosphotransfer) domain-containing protein